MNRPDEPPLTSDRLREDIDQGKAGDKVNHPDPAAAPLGTDDEAAGTPITDRQLLMAQDQLRDPDTPAPKPVWMILLLIVAAIVILWLLF